MLTNGIMGRHMDLISEAVDGDLAVLGLSTVRHELLVDRSGAIDNLLLDDESPETALERALMDEYAIALQEADGEVLARVYVEEV